MFYIFLLLHCFCCLLLKVLLHIIIYAYTKADYLHNYAISFHLYGLTHNKLCARLVKNIVFNQFWKVLCYEYDDSFLDIFHHPYTNWQMRIHLYRRYLSKFYLSSLNIHDLVYLPSSQILECVLSQVVLSSSFFTVYYLCKWIQNFFVFEISALKSEVGHLLSKWVDWLDEARQERW